jgi:hypothetical protein
VYILRSLLLSALPLLALSMSPISCHAAEGPEAEMKEYEKAAKARGVRWTLAEFRPARVPPAEDAALLPVFAASKDYENQPSPLPRLSEGRAPKHGALPAIDWKTTRKRLPNPGLKIDPSEPDDVRALDAALRPLQPTVDQLCQSKAVAANWGDETWKGNLDGAFPQSHVLMHCFRLLQFRAALDLALGRSDGARKAIEAQLRLARVSSRIPTIILHLVTLVGVFQSRENVWRGIETGAWTDETLRSFAEQLLGWNVIADFQWSLDSERAWSREAGKRIAQDADKLLAALTYNNPETFDEAELRKVITDPAYQARNQLWWERSMDEQASMLDPTAGTWRPVERKFDTEKLTKAQRQLDLAMCSRSSMEPYLQKAVWIHAHNHMAAIACGLELARRANGKYPSALEALVPTHLPRLPIDPTSGEAFRYRVEPNGSYLLYSVGFDRKDDGGKTGSEEQRDPSDPDWLWFVPTEPPLKPSR